MPDERPEFCTLSPEVQADILARYMKVFAGNPRGYGWATGGGAFFNPEKNKGEYRPGHIGWKWGAATESQYRDHLEGKIALGISPLLEDGTTLRVEIDVDKIGSDNKYEFNYPDIMQSIKNAKLPPCVVYRTKSSGVRIVFLFKTPIDAEQGRRAGVVAAAKCGLAGNEIFPKQSHLQKDDDAPSWVFLPEGPVFNVFAPQCGMNGRGNAMTLLNFIEECERNMIEPDQFMLLIYDEDRVRGAGHAHGANGHNAPKRPKGIWAEEDTKAATIKEMHKGGPPCMFHISQQGCADFQHNFLFGLGCFLKKKYPENWDKALTWANFNILEPPGNPEKLMAIIKDVKNRDYEYRCKDEPLYGHCMADACRRQPFGVGKGKGRFDFLELGITIVDCEPKRFYVTVGTSRVSVTPEQLLSMKSFRQLSLSYYGDFPENMKQSDWDDQLRPNLENATHVEPAYVMRSNAREIETLQEWFTIQLPTQVRSFGQEALDGKVGDNVRLKIKEGRVYFKWDKLVRWLRQITTSEANIENMRNFVTTKGTEYGRTELRDWYRSTVALPLSLFDEGVVDRWLHPDEQEIGGDHGGE